MSQDVTRELTRLANGEIDALDELYDLLSARIFNYARSIMKNREAAEDVVHDIFLRIYGQATKLAKMRNPVAYIMVATRNLAYDHMKRSGYHSSTLDEMHDVAAAPMLYDSLPDVLSVLPANQRETVYLHYVCGFTQKEVAKIMSVPLATVKWRCKKAKQSLQAYYQTEGGNNLCDILIQ